MDESSQPSRSAPVAWALYDFAYSAFTFLLVVRFFPSWIIDDYGKPDWYVSLTQVAVVLVVLVALPLCGAAADQLGRRKPFLITFTLVSAGACAMLSVVPIERSIVLALAVAGVAVAFAQLAFGQYDPLLADVAHEREYGRVSGLAVALGFLGIIFGLAVVAELVVGEGSKQRAFAPAALLYVVVALPALLLIHEQRRPQATAGRLARRAYGQLRESLGKTGQYPRVFRFLVGRLLYSEAIATLSAFLAVYMTRLGGFSEREKNLVIGVAVLAAALGAIGGGRLVQRLGPKRRLVAVLPMFSACVLVSAVVGQAWTVWALSPIIGITLGVVWTADRVFMLRLAPHEVRGQLFGFFNLSSRVASAIGPLLIWSGTLWVFHEKTNLLSALGASRLALAGLAAAALFGWAVIRPIREDRESEGVGAEPVFT